MIWPHDAKNTRLYCDVLKSSYCLTIDETMKRKGMHFSKYCKMIFFLKGPLMRLQTKTLLTDTPNRFLFDSPTNCTYVCSSDINKIPFYMRSTEQIISCLFFFSELFSRTLMQLLFVWQWIGLGWVIYSCHDQIRQIPDLY